MEQTLTAKLRLYPTEAQAELLAWTMDTYRNACGYISFRVWDTRTTDYRTLHNSVYDEVRYGFGLGAQTAQSAIHTVLAAYKAIESNGHKWTEVQFERPLIDLVRGRDYSFAKDGLLSVWTVAGRTKVAWSGKGFERYLYSSTYRFGTAKIVCRDGKWYFHVPVTFEVPDCDTSAPSDIVGVDRGVNFAITTYDNAGKTRFVSGRALKNKRTDFKILRRDLQKRQTPSARRRLKKIGQRENRWMQNENHCIAKTLVNSCPSGTLFVLEDLTGIRSATEKVRRKDRYAMVSWSFYDLQQKIEYKARMNGSAVLLVDPAYTSQKCPQCGHAERANRDKKNHTLCCRKCGCRSNDDRVGAMNIRDLGVQHVADQAVADG